jgi:tRNA threonylcarbamoyladenosine biosynthesis protein TsaE
MQVKCNLDSVKQTEILGQELALVLAPGLLIGFKGEIGRGKTCLIRSMLKTLGVKTAIKSPTFNLVETYQTDIGSIHHFDLYRLTSIYDLEDLGFRDYLNMGQICCIEWPENAPLLLPQLDLIIDLDLQTEEDGRIVTFSSQTPLGEQVILNLLGRTCLEFV